MTDLKNTTYIDAYHIGISFINKSQAFSFASITSPSKEKPWISIIEGISSEFGFERKFMSSRTESISPNLFQAILDSQYHELTLKKVQQSFIMYSWKLISGHVYEYKNFMCAFDAPQKDSGYFGVSEAGIKFLTKDELRRTMNLRVKGDTKVESKKSALEHILNKPRMIDEFAKKEKVKKNKRQEQLDFKIGD
jgi:hypothetical protein